MAIAAYLFQNEIVANFKKFTTTDNSCSSSEQLEVALLDETLWPGYVAKCQDFFTGISDEQFQVKLTQLSESSSRNSAQVWFNIGKLYDVNFDQHLLRILKPEVKPEVDLAIGAYSKAKEANVTGAAALLRAACQNTNTPYLKLVTEKECKGL